ncbi:MAG: recombinase family protein [Proteobacteria bacterium]|nr:recombinase family protein [Candidatus Enterousia scatequi]
MIYGYCRVSTAHQNEANQRFVIEKFARANNISIDSWLQETISSSKKLSERKLGELLKKLQSGDILITTEISRLGRSLLEVMGILQTCLEKNCQVWTLKENFRLGADIQSKVLAFAFSLTAELSKTLLQERVRESLARMKASGKKLGRPLGARSRSLKLSKNKLKIAELMSQGVSKNEICRIMKVDKRTLYTFINEQPAI